MPKIADVNFKHLPDKVGFKSEDDKKFPSVILIAAGSPCNLKCPGCPSTNLQSIRNTINNAGQLELYLRPDYYKKIVDECREYITDSFKPRIRISGYGEPLLHKNLIGMIDYSSGNGVPTSLITNGLLLNEEKAERLIRAGIESIEISVDGHEKNLYESIRVGGDFDVLKNNVKNLVMIRNRLQQDKKTIIIASIVKGHYNHKVIEEIRTFWEEMGVDHVSIRKFLTWGIPELVKMQQEMNEGTYLGAGAPCPYPFERLMIDPAGWIRLCPYDDQCKIPPFGHLSNNSISEAWQGERFNQIRRCHDGKFDEQMAAAEALLCAECEDRLNRSWTFNYLSIVESEK